MDAWTPRGQRVILVEDDAALLSALTFAFEVEGIETAAYASAEAALADDLMDAACLVIDYGLPGANGLDLLRRLRGQGCQARAILITSHPNASALERAASLGAAVVEKPLLSDDLVEAVRRSLIIAPLGAPD